jgi:uncharacterized protein YndB with AHSA1/START domain
VQTKTLQQTVTFKASPQEVYDMLMDSKKHQSLSGVSAKISKKVGGKFTAWGSHLSGINLVLKPGKKIVQAWRATGWWPDHYSIAIFDISKVRGGSKLKFTQIGIPPGRYSGPLHRQSGAGLKPPQVWPNCHSPVTHGKDANEYNAMIADNVKAAETLLQSETQ